MPSLRPILLLGALTLAVPLDAAAATAITTPMTGESVASPFTVTVTYGTITECDTGGCYDTEVSSLSLFMDGAFVDSCSATTECPNGSASFEVEAAPGEHSLAVDASNFGFSQESSETVTITVVASEESTGSSGGETDGGSSGGEGSTTDAGTGTTGGATAGDGDDDLKGGCGCTSGGGGSGAGLGLLALTVLAGRRRRAPLRA